MRFLPFLAILIVAAGTLLLGVDLMTLPQKPAAQLTGAPPKPLASAPNKLAQHEADLRAENTEGDSGLRRGEPGQRQGRARGLSAK